MFYLGKCRRNWRISGGEARAGISRCHEYQVKLRIHQAEEEESMATNPSIASITNNPKYKELVRQRDSLAWSLTAVVIIIYFGFTLLVAFAGDFLSQPIAADSVIPIGIPLGVGVIVISILLTGFYVYRANTTFDDLTHDILREGTK
jgi:uncharacterized membrane protein (DUF485 family)